MTNSFNFGQADVLFTDVDDTLTTDGQLLPETYLALCRLAAAGIRVIPVTGVAPAGATRSSERGRSLP